MCKQVFAIFLQIKVYTSRKALGHALNDTKTAVKQVESYNWSLVSCHIHHLVNTFGCINDQVFGGILRKIRGFCFLVRKHLQEYL